MTSPTGSGGDRSHRSAAIKLVLDRLLPEGTAPVWFTLWLIFALATVVAALGALVALAYFAGPLAPSLLTGVGAITAGGGIVARKRARRP